MDKDHYFHHAFEHIQINVEEHGLTIVHLLNHARKVRLMCKEFLTTDKNNRVIHVPKKYF